MTLDQQLCFTVHKLARQFDQLYRPILTKHAITYPQYLVLLVLWKNDRLTVTEIGNQLKLDSGTLSPMLKRMEKSELIVRKRALTDERRVVIALSDTGRALEEALKNDVANCFAAFNLPTTKESEILIKLNELSKLLNEGSLKNE